MKDRSIGILCLLSALNHAMLYVAVIVLPLLGAMFTKDAALIGLFMTPVPACRGWQNWEFLPA